MSKIKKVLFMGSKQLGLRVLSEIYSLSPNTLIGCLTFNDKEDTRSVPGDFEDFSRVNNIILYVADNKQHSEKIINQLKPDLCLVVGWYWLISNKTLNAVPYGFIGIHNSLLPKFRGGSPLVWAIIAGEVTIGFSLFSFTTGMDDGPIWAQGSISIEKKDYISDILVKLENKAIEVLQEKYVSILMGSIKPVEQNHEQATYSAARFPGDGKIDWSKSGGDVYNFIRAQSHPYPGAFTYLESQILRIWKAKPLNIVYYGTPGQVAKITNEGVCVVCGNNTAIIIEDVDFLGKSGKANKVITSIKVRFPNHAEKI